MSVKKLLGKRQKQANSCNNKCLKEPMHPFPRLRLCHGNIASDSPNLPPRSSSPQQPWASSGEGAGWQASQVMWSVEETWYLVSVERYCEMNRCLVGKGELYYLGWAVKRVRWRARDSECTQSEQSFHKEPWSSRLNPWKSHKHKCMSKHIPLSHSLISFNTQTHKHDSHCPSAHHTHSIQ